jgi:two-component system cell cycle sensor histidine kinase/response regulator CckA
MVISVLILDDDPGVLELASIYLSKKGYSTLACASPASALEKFREAGGSIDVLVADVTLAGASGIETACQLKAVAPQLKILFVSGYALDELGDSDLALIHLLPADSVRYLRKPYSSKDLLEQIAGLSSTLPQPGIRQLDLAAGHDSTECQEWTRLTTSSKD